MNFEERLARRIKIAGESVPGNPLEFSTVMDRARGARRRYMVAVAAAAAVILAVAGTAGALLLRDGDQGARPVPPADETQPTPTEPERKPAPTCSAQGMSPILEEPARPLPPSVGQMRVAIVQAAAACDYEELARLGQGEDENFVWSFGGASAPPPQRFWREEEHLDTEPLANLVRLLNMDFVVERYGGMDHHIWPTAHRSSGPTPEDLDALVGAGVLTEEDAEAMGEAGSYLGWRLSISESGDWEFYTAGD